MENPFQLLHDKLVVIENLVRELKIIPEGRQEVVFDLKQTCEYVGVTKATIYGYTSARKIPHYKMGKKLYFKKSDLDKWLTSNKIASMEEIKDIAETFVVRRQRKISI